MDRFPASVRRLMKEAGALVTCLPVQFDKGTWETAFFIHVDGPECKRDRRILSRLDHPIAIGMEADLIEHENASVVVIRLEVHTQPDNPMAGEILLTPGEVVSHFETLELLSEQDRVSWFFANGDYEVIHSQQCPIDEIQRQGYADLLRDAVRHDAVVRCTGRYDANASLSSVTASYQVRMRNNFLS